MALCQAEVYKSPWLSETRPLDWLRAVHYPAEQVCPETEELPICVSTVRVLNETPQKVLLFFQTSRILCIVLHHIVKYTAFILEEK